VTTESEAQSNRQVPVPMQPIGALLVAQGALKPEQVTAILSYQTEHRVRFGEAAIILGMASDEDVLEALSRQFGYAHGNAARRERSPELVVLNQPSGVQAEAIRAARAQLMLRLSSGPMDLLLAGRSLAVVSAEQGVGRTFFVANLAVALAQLGRRVIVVDADLRTPRLHEVFDIKQGVGLSGLLSSKRSDDVIQPIEDVDNLYVLPAGAPPPNPLELLENPDFTALLDELCKRFDHVLLDTPSQQLGSDVLAVCARSDACLMLVHRNRTRTRQAQHLLEGLNNTGTMVVGTVVNDF
jgi:protein-tyrosine kinase